MKKGGECLNKNIVTNEVFYLLADLQIMSAEEKGHKEKAFNTIINDVKKHAYKEVVIASLGDEVEGMLRPQSERNDGVIKCSILFQELFTSFIKKLAKITKVKIIYVDRSNHTQLNRQLDKKGISFAYEDMSILILNQIKKDLKGVKNVSFIEPQHIEGYSETKEGGVFVYKNFVFAHGHQKVLKTVRKAEMYLKELELNSTYRYYIQGHLHHHKMVDVKTGKLIYVGALKSSVTEYDINGGFENRFPQFQKL
jgi:hypothetical protein